MDLKLNGKTAIRPRKICVPELASTFSLAQTGHLVTGNNREHSLIQYFQPLTKEELKMVWRMIAVLSCGLSNMLSQCQTRLRGWRASLTGKSDTFAIEVACAGNTVHLQSPKNFRT